MHTNTAIPSGHLYLYFKIMLFSNPYNWSTWGTFCMLKETKTNQYYQDPAAMTAYIFFNLKRKDLEI
jgi:hypothetical protein